jgi:hypothetical protein
VTSTVFYDDVNEIAMISASFTNPAGAPADPTTISCIVTEPSGLAVTHTYAGPPPADIVKLMAGKYTLSVPCSPSLAGIDGLWGYKWVGTGVVSDVQPGTWRVMPDDISRLWYVGLEEMRDRLGVTEPDEDYALQTSIAAATNWISEYCGRHFNRVTETRTYQPHSIWVLHIDDLVDDPSIDVAVDQDGDGTYEDHWVRGTDYVLRQGDMNFNPNATGTPRPFRQLQVVQSGKWLPFTWPYSNLDRVSITGPWGWKYVPWAVTEACRMLTADIFKFKDAPFGVAGVSDIGVIRANTNPWIIEQLQPYVSRRKVGI